MADISLVEGDNVLNVPLSPIPPPMANLSGVVTDAETGIPLAGVSLIFNGRQTFTDAVGRYAITDLEVEKLSIAFSHVDYDAYWTEITLAIGDNTLDVALTPAVTGQITLYEGYNLVTYTGKLQTVGAAFASLSHLSFIQVLHFVDSAYYETTCRGTTECVESTKMMIPGDNYWVAVYQDCIWTF